jgi:hypothetical protein
MQLPKQPSNNLCDGCVCRYETSTNCAILMKFTVWLRRCCETQALLLCAETLYLLHKKGNIIVPMTVWLGKYKMFAVRNKRAAPGPKN